MKKIIVASFVLLIAACHINYANYKHPAGYKPCNSSWDCDHARGEFCGFIDVDTYAVCRT